MKKFIILFEKDSPTIFEVDVEVKSSNHLSLKDGEWIGKIITDLPKSIDTKSLWCWWAFNNSVVECYEKIRKEYLRILEKENREYSSLEVNELLNNVKIVFLK